MKTALQKKLALVAPYICINTIWGHDHDWRDIREDCDGFENEDPADWQAWQSEIRATAIEKGAEFSGSAYIGGTWEKAGDDPAESNPEISGYENQMTVVALKELKNSLSDSVLIAQINSAISAI